MIRSKNELYHVLHNFLFVVCLYEVLSNITNPLLNLLKIMPNFIMKVWANDNKVFCMSFFICLETGLDLIWDPGMRSNYSMYCITFFCWSSFLFFGGMDASFKRLQIFGKSIFKVMFHMWYEIPSLLRRYCLEYSFVIFPLSWCMYWFQISNPKEITDS